MKLDEGREEGLRKVKDDSRKHPIFSLGLIGCTLFLILKALLREKDDIYYAKGNARDRKYVFHYLSWNGQYHAILERKPHFHSKDQNFILAHYLDRYDVLIDCEGKTLEEVKRIAHLKADQIEAQMEK